MLQRPEATTTTKRDHELHPLTPKWASRCPSLLQAGLRRGSAFSSRGRKERIGAVPTRLSNPMYGCWQEVSHRLGYNKGTAPGTRPQAAGTKERLRGRMRKSWTIGLTPWGRMKPRREYRYQLTHTLLRTRPPVLTPTSPRGAKHPRHSPAVHPPVRPPPRLLPRPAPGRRSVASQYLPALQQHLLHSPPPPAPGRQAGAQQCLRRNGACQRLHRIGAGQSLRRHGSSQSLSAPQQHLPHLQGPQTHGSIPPGSKGPVPTGTRVPGTASCTPERRSRGESGLSSWTSRSVRWHASSLTRPGPFPMASG